MCAIMGVLEQKKTVNIAVLKEMQKTLRHRGPDDDGEELLSFGSEEKNLGVGFVRLSIRDLTLNGHQPMWMPYHDVMIAFNGEIYNSEELRPELIKDGVQFRSNSDTEVLLNLYYKRGVEGMLPLLDGMFAICIYDSRVEKLFLIRDRIGEKPLYIYDDGSLFMFASEYKAFYSHPHFKPELNQDAVNEYFVFRYLTDNQTFLNHVTNLAPGHYLEISAKEKKKVLHQYWQIPDSTPNKLSFEENKENVKKLIDKSLTRRLISDRPVGLQLSGGIDSSYIAYLAQQKVSSPIHSYGVTFSNKSFSEEKYIDYVSQQVGCVSHKIEFSVEDFIDCWRKSIWYFDSPQNLPGTMGLLKLNRIAKNEITVILCGDGPDEMQGGYTRFSVIARELNPSVAGRFMHLMRCFSGIVHRTPVPILYNNDKYYVNCFRFISEDFFRKLFPERGGKASKAVVRKRLDMLKRTPGKGLRKYMNYEMQTYMQDILMRSDKVSMASSVELRVPYLMPELIEYSTTIPDEQLVDGNTDEIMRHTKKIMKSISSDVFGDEFTYRDKMGFSFPLLDFFDNKEVSDYVEKELLPGIRNRGVVNYDFFEELWLKRHYYRTNGDKDLRSVIYSLWSVLSFEIWAQMFLDKKPQDFIEFANSRDE